MDKIILGGATHVVNNKTGYQLQRFETWYRKDPKRAIGDILGDSAPRDVKSRADLVRRTIKAFKLGMTCVQFLGYLHEQIAQMYIDSIDRWTALHPDDAVRVHFVELSEAHPPNYTENMARLKNLRFDGWDAQNMKGFCPHEPVERMQQLLDFPIKRFAPMFQLPHVDFSNAPVIRDGKLAMATAADVHGEVAGMASDFQAWERYYDALSREIQKLCERLTVQN